jgi:hypothetical protein
MKWRYAMAALLVASSGASAQWEPGFSGYVVTMPAYLRLNPDIAASSGLDQDQLANVTRLRLRPSLSFPWDALLEVEYEMSGLIQSTDQPLLVEQRDIGRQVFDLRWTIAESDHYAVIHFIDRLVYRQRLPAGELAVGRQRISWGTGRIWNPTDLFNPINPVNFAKIEKDGADAVSAKLFLGTLSDVQAVWNPAGNAPANYGARFRSHVETFDFSLLGGYFDSSPVAGFDMAGDLGESGVRAEFLYSGLFTSDAEQYAKLIVGADHQFTPEFYGLVEYHFNGLGTSDRDAYDIEGLFGGTVLNVARHYVAGMASYLVHPLVTVSLMGTVNLNDASQFYSATATCSAADELVLGAGVQLFAGGVGDEFWYYPFTTYFKLDFYF